MRSTEDCHKTKTQLIAEVEELRSEVAKLKRENSAHNPHSLTHAQEHSCLNATFSEQKTQCEIGDNLPNGFLYQVVRDADNRDRFTYISASVERETGLRSQAVLEDASLLYDLIVEEDRDRFNKAIATAVQTRTMLDVQFREYTSEGVRWVRVCSSPRTLSNGQLAWEGIRLDITDHKQAEAALQESEAQLRRLNEELEQRVQERTQELERSQAILHQREQEFRTLVENAPDSILRLDSAFRYLYVNPAAVIGGGISANDCYGKTSDELGFPKSIVALWHDSLQRALDTHQEQVLEFSFPFPEGLRYYQSRVVPEVNADGTADSVLVVMRDITSLKQAKEALRQQVDREQLLGAIAQRIRQSLDLDEILATAVVEVREILQADRVLIFQLTQDGAGQVVQESVVPAYPVTAEMRFPDECFPIECYNYYLKGQARIVSDVMSDRWASCIGNFMQQVGVKSKIVAPIIQHRENAASTIWGLLIVHACAAPRQWDVAEAELLQRISNQLAIALQQAELHQQLQAELYQRRRIEVALQQSEALFRSLSESSPIGIFRTDQHNQLIYTNPRCQALFGITAEEALGTGWQRFVHPEDLKTVVPECIAATAAKQEHTGELRHIRPDGTIRLFQVRTAPVLAANGRLMGRVGTVEDITEQRAIDYLKTEFISIVSHELRTPLASIRGALGLLASKVLQDDPKATDHMLEVAEIEAERLVRLVNDILDLERLGSNKVMLNKQWCDAENLVQRSIEALQPLAEENQIRFTIQSSPIQIWADVDRMIQTLVNLISNAIKFSPQNSTVTVSVQTQSACLYGASPTASEMGSNRQVLFQVKDQGRGIPSDQLESIFGRFQQVDTSDARQKGGTGLGLAICRSIVQQHDGQIWVESHLGKGSTFYFAVPLPRRNQDANQAGVADRR